MRLRPPARAGGERSTPPRPGRPGGRRGRRGMQGGRAGRIRRVPRHGAVRMSEPLRFRRASTGDVVETEAEAEDTQFRAGEYMMGRMVKLDDGTVLRQHRVPAGEARDKG